MSAKVDRRYTREELAVLLDVELDFVIKLTTDYGIGKFSISQKNTISGGQIEKFIRESSSRNVFRQCDRNGLTEVIGTKCLRRLFPEYIAPLSIATINKSKVLELKKQGLSRSQISYRLSLTTKQVDKYIERSNCIYLRENTFYHRENNKIEKVLGTGAYQRFRLPLDCLTIRQFCDAYDLIDKALFAIVRCFNGTPTPSESKRSQACSHKGWRVIDSKIIKIDR